MKKNILFLCFAFLSTQVVFAQEKGNEINRTQLTLMVVPVSSKGEDIRAKIESDFAYKAAINAISKAFEDRGYTTTDFIEAFKNTISDQTVNAGSTQTDLWKLIQENSPADVFVQAEIHIQPLMDGSRKVQLLLSAVDKYSSERLASSDLLESNSYRTEDYAKLTVLALTQNDAISKFLNGLNVKFQDISTNGRTVDVKLQLNQDCQLKFTDEIGTEYDVLSDLIVDWVKKNAFKNYYHIKSNSDKMLWFDAIKIPVKNEDKTNYLPEDFKKSFYKFLRSLSPKVKTGKLEIESHITGSKISFNIK